MSKNFLKFWGILSCLLVIFISFPLGSQEGGTGKSKDKWQTFKTPEEAGFSSAKMELARQYWETLKPAAASIFIVYKGKVLVAWGRVTFPFLCHSIRKSFLSALYGIHVEEGHIDLQKTMAELNIDDDPPLTEEEKQAKVIHLIKARSGVYHEAAAETPEMRDLRPPRGSHPPGTFWYYNNWDFNALGIIFEQETGMKIFEDFKTRIADPIGMQDFNVSYCNYYYELQYSLHPAYVFRMSARDRARFGLLFLQEGRWENEQLITKQWVKKSTRSYSDASLGLKEAKGRGYGFMWWIMAKRTPILKNWKHLAKVGPLFYASGYKGHVIMIMPKIEMVFVQVVDTDQGLEVEFPESATLMDMILDAKEFEIFDLAALETWFGSITVPAGGKVNLLAKVENLSQKKSKAASVSFYFSVNKALDKKDVLIGRSGLPRIKSNKNKVVILTSALPATIVSGDYYLIAVVDEEDQNHDPHKENNVAVSTEKITIQ